MIVAVCTPVDADETVMNVVVVVVTKYVDMMVCVIADCPSCLAT